MQQLLFECRECSDGEPSIDRACQQDSGTSLDQMIICLATPAVSGNNILLFK
jgi:hypothetical protein